MEYRLRINVKDRVLYRHHHEFAELIEKLEAVESLVPELSPELIYQDVVEDFWDIAKDLASEFGFGEDVVLQEGRSGGWLVLNLAGELTPELEESYGSYISNIAGTMEAAREMFLYRLQEAVSDLEARQEASIIRSEN